MRLVGLLGVAVFIFSTAAFECLAFGLKMDTVRAAHETSLSDQADSSRRLAALVAELESAKQRWADACPDLADIREELAACRAVLAADGTSLWPQSEVRAELAAGGTSLWPKPEARDELVATCAELVATRAELVATHAELVATRAENANYRAELVAARAEVADAHTQVRSARDALAAINKQLAANYAIVVKWLEFSREPPADMAEGRVTAGEKPKAGDSSRL